MEQDKVNKVSDGRKNAWVEDGEKGKKMNQKNKVNLGQRWNMAQASKTMVFWSIIGAIVLTMIVGFNWGGWVSGGKALRMAELTAQDAVTQRLVPMCVFQFNQDPQKSQKLLELNETRNYQRDDYVIEQGWATMPGEDQPDSRVASECAKLIFESNQ